MTPLKFRIPLNINIQYELQEPIITIDASIIQLKIQEEIIKNQEDIDRHKSKKYVVIRRKEELIALERKQNLLDKVKIASPALIDCRVAEFSSFKWYVRYAGRQRKFISVFCSECEKEVGLKSCAFEDWEYDFGRPEDVHRLWGYNVFCDRGHLILSDITAVAD